MEKAKEPERKGAEAGRNGMEQERKSAGPERRGSPPPPYSAEPVSYPEVINERSGDLDANEVKEKKEEKDSGTAPPLPPTPFSNGFVTASIHPTVDIPTIPISSSEGINPASGATSAPFVAANHKVKSAKTTEPHDEFCPKCQCQIRTKQTHKSGRLTWLLAFIILILFFPIAFVPFLIDSCKDVRHYCPKCNLLLSVKKRLCC